MPTKYLLGLNSQKDVCSRGSKILSHRTLRIRGSITVTVGLTSCLFCLHSAALLMQSEDQLYFAWSNPNSQTGGQPYSDTSLEVSECSPIDPFNINGIEPHNKEKSLIHFCIMHPHWGFHFRGMLVGEIASTISEKHGNEGFMNDCAFLQKLAGRMGLLVRISVQSARKGNLR